MVGVNFISVASVLLAISATGVLATPVPAQGSALVKRGGDHDDNDYSGVRHHRSGRPFKHGHVAGRARGKLQKFREQDNSRPHGHGMHGPHDGSIIIPGLDQEEQEHVVHGHNLPEHFTFRPHHGHEGGPHDGHGFGKGAGHRLIHKIKGRKFLRENGYDAYPEFNVPVEFVPEFEEEYNHGGCEGGCEEEGRFDGYDSEPEYEPEYKHHGCDGGCGEKEEDVTIIVPETEVVVIEREREREQNNNHNVNISENENANFNDNENEEEEIIVPVIPVIPEPEFEFEPECDSCHHDEDEYESEPEIEFEPEFFPVPVPVPVYPSVDRSENKNENVNQNVNINANDNENDDADIKVVPVVPIIPIEREKEHDCHRHFGCGGGPGPFGPHGHHGRPHFGPRHHKKHGHSFGRPGRRHRGSLFERIIVPELLAEESGHRCNKFDKLFKRDSMPEGLSAKDLVECFMQDGETFFRK